MLSRLPLLLAAGPLYTSLAPTRAADRMHGLVPLKHGSCYCQRTLVATHIANLWVSAPGWVVQWLDNSGAFSILPHHDLAVQLMLGREERGTTYIHVHVVVECLLQCQPGASYCAANVSQNIQHSLPNSQHLLFLKASSCCLQLITQVVVQAPISANRCIANYSFLFREAACRRLLLCSLGKKRKWIPPWLLTRIALILRGRLAESVGQEQTELLTNLPNWQLDVHIWIHSWWFSGRSRRDEQRGLVMSLLSGLRNPGPPSWEASRIFSRAKRNVSSSCTSSPWSVREIPRSRYSHATTSSIYARVNCSVVRDWCTRVQGHPRNLFQRPWNFGLSSLKHHTWPYHASVLLVLRPKGAFWKPVANWGRTKCFCINGQWGRQTARQSSFERCRSVLSCTFGRFWFARSLQYELPW